jgi:hypothetical protein
MSNYPDILDQLNQPPIIPAIPVDLELIKLRDCYPYRRLYPALHHFTDPETGALDYVSESARITFDTIEDELHKLGFRRQEIVISAGAALFDLVGMRQYIEFVEDPGDLFAYV